MAKKLYIEYNSGIIEDMVVGALIDFGINQNKLVNILQNLPIEGY